MRFPDLLQDFIRLQYRVSVLIHEVELLRKQFHEITPVGDLRSLVSRETFDAPGDPTEIAGGEVKP